MRVLTHRVLVWLCFGLILWLVGLGWFMQQIQRPPAGEDQSKTDAIVVLTGGPGRLEFGVRLLIDGKADTLFVSGVGQSVTQRELLLQLPADLRAKIKNPAGSIILGYEAENTIGNAQETAKWVKASQIGSIRLVTADYHMPRSLVEFSQAMPNLKLIPCPVTTEEFSAFEWWQNKESRSRLLSEYHKYIAGHFRHFLLSLGI